MLGEALNAEEKAMQLTIDALKDAAARPGPGQPPLSCSRASTWPPNPTGRAIRPQNRTPGAGPVSG
jgi:hypothetical protein